MEVEELFLKEILIGFAAVGFEVVQVSGLFR